MMEKRGQSSRSFRTNDDEDVLPGLGVSHLLGSI
jgi:hypothetical protein